jgi:hypothetical protein
MKIQLIAISLLAMVTLNGCSFLSKLKAPKSPINVEPAVYNFASPRRSTLDRSISSKLQTPSVNGLGYYSASGYRCRTLSLNPIKSACYVENKWLAAAPILNTKLP